MRIKRSFAPYHINDIAGFSPETAFYHYQEKVAIPEEPGAKDAPPPPLPEGKENDGDAPGVTSSDVTRPDVIPIPEGWEKIHHLQRIALAQRISKEKAPEGIKPLEHAEQIIRAEVERRANPKT